MILNRDQARREVPYIPSAGWKAAFGLRSDYNTMPGVCRTMSDRSHRPVRQSDGDSPTCQASAAAVRARRARWAARRTPFESTNRLLREHFQRCMPSPSFGQETAKIGELAIEHRQRRRGAFVRVEVFGLSQSLHSPGECMRVQQVAPRSRLRRPKRSTDRATSRAVRTGTLDGVDARYIWARAWRVRGVVAGSS